LLGAEVDVIRRDGDRLTVDAGSEHASAPLVVMATGVAPRGELMAAAGGHLVGGAIPVDSAMRTEFAGLLAAGDVCLADNPTAGRALRVEHWGDALGQGTVAGRTAAGETAAWSDVPGFWSTIGERTLKYAAWGDGFDEARLSEGSDGSFTVWYGHNGRVAGVLAHDADADYERGRELIAAGAVW
jgi:NADPH-dependent 2,4-dienoyl-CoA reductase/sulfur reductase-like enzyme